MLLVLASIGRSIAIIIIDITTIIIASVVAAAVNDHGWTRIVYIGGSAEAGAGAGAGAGVSAGASASAGAGAGGGPEVADLTAAMAAAEAKPC